MSTTTTDLTIIDRLHGEILDVRDATTERLAQAVTNMQELRAQLADEEKLVSDELIARLDREARWTLSVGDPREGRVWVIKAPSPEAGTTVYPPDLLEHELRQLVERGTITADAAAMALKRTVTIELDVPLDLTAPLSEVARELKEVTITGPEGVELKVAKTDYARRSVDGGIKKLSKVPGTGAALDRAAQKTEPARKASVKLEEKAVRA